MLPSPISPPESRVLGWALALTAVWGCAPTLPGQGAAEANAVAKAVHPLLRSSAPAVRGEAALALATAISVARSEVASPDMAPKGTNPIDAFGAILEVSKDPHPVARIRGVIALGLLATAGVEIRLQDLLNEAGARPDGDTVAAALGLGLLPDNHPGIGVEEYFSQFMTNSQRRHGDVLRAMLIGLAGAHPNKVVALRDLIEDANLRDPDLRLLVREVLSRSPHGLDRDQSMALLGSSEASSRALGATLSPALLHQRRGPDRDLTRAEAEENRKILHALERLARKDSKPRVRTAALQALTVARHLPALEIAASAAASPDPEEAAQAARTAVHLGGQGMTRALEGRVLATAKPALQAALLEALPGPWSDAYAEACRALAADRDADHAVRVHAAIVAAQAKGDAGPLLRTLFGEVAEPELLNRLAAHIVTSDANAEADVAPIDDLSPTSRPLDAVRLEALLRAGHPDAIAQVTAELMDPRADDARQVELLRAWRRARSTLLSQAVIDRLPRVLQRVL